MSRSKTTEHFIVILKDTQGRVFGPASKQDCKDWIVTQTDAWPGDKKAFKNRFQIVREDF